MATPLLVMVAEQDWLDGHVTAIATIGYCLAFFGGLILCASAGRKWGNLNLWSRVLTVAGLTATILLGIAALVGMCSYVASFG